MWVELKVESGLTELEVAPRRVGGMEVLIDTDGAEFMQTLTIDSRGELEDLIFALTVVGKHAFPEND